MNLENRDQDVIVKLNPQDISIGTVLEGVNTELFDLLPLSIKELSLSAFEMALTNNVSELSELNFTSTLYSTALPAFGKISLTNLNLHVSVSNPINSDQRKINDLYIGGLIDIEGIQFNLSIPFADFSKADFSNLTSWSMDMDFPNGLNYEGLKTLVANLEIPGLNHLPDFNIPDCGLNVNEISLSKLHLAFSTINNDISLKDFLLNWTHLLQLISREIMSN
ncbi:MAG: hypothetical protein OMM_06060 [Candidatus Magnetoglobus multicellularis str. Araruama]|uniref:Uncharacterized protein n=1 Tax=Candidatus Magnetoglobus multicellularis str. Araruama TaxID=890399 RepID=A0A1V1NS47_9BACT|nr:MAG: hypothetical protein OMM_06060 [Candidatus Magnetoglobus multicellularis str. Araruama]